MKRINNHHNLNQSDKLVNRIQDMIKQTQSGNLEWEVFCQTTEFNDEAAKPTVQEDGILYTVDECYVSYHTTYQGREFLLITYEMIHTHGKDKTSNNLVFEPPLGIRFFDVHTLLPYAVEADQILIYQLHALWETILQLKKENSPKINLTVENRDLTIDD